MLKKIRNRIFISIAIAGLFYLAFTIYSDFDKVLIAFSNFNWLILPILLLLSLGNYISRFFKWQYYLKLVNVKLHLMDSLSIFMSGLVMSVTPGKFGELLKAYLIKQVNNTPISKTAPIIVAERATDFLSLTLIAIAGAYIFEYDKSILIIITVIIISFIFLLTNKTLSEKSLNFLSRIKFLEKHAERMYNLYESSFKLLSLFPLVLMTLLSVISWGFECLGYYIVLTNFGLTINIFWAFFSYSFSTIVGAASMLPGGLGVTEGSLTLMVMKKGLSKSEAFTATFIVRVVTLWFAVLIGAISVLFYQKRFGNISEELNGEIQS